MTPVSFPLAEFELQPSSLNSVPGRASRHFDVLLNVSSIKAGVLTTRDENVAKCPQSGRGGPRDHNSGGLGARS